jgi:hypothetical protein
VSDFDIDGFLRETLFGERPEVPSPVQRPANAAKVGSLRDVFTGENRATVATERLPELSMIGAGGNPFRAAAAMTSFDPEEQIAILAQDKPIRVLLTDPEGRNAWFDVGSGTPINTRTGEPAARRRGVLNLPEGWSLGDQQGNVILEREGQRAVLNQPGVSPMDALQLGAVGAAFTPAGRAGVGAPTLFSGIGRVGVASAATQVPLEVAQAAAGGDFSAGDVALSGGFGAAGQGVVGGLAKMLPVPLLRQLAGASNAAPDQIPPELTIRVQQEAQRLGLDPAIVNRDFMRDLTAAARNATNPSTDEIAAVAGAGEFQIPLTRGEISLDQGQLSLEDSMRVGALGTGEGSPQELMLGQQATARDAANNAFSNIRLQAGGPQIENPSQAGAIVRQGIQEAEAAASEAVSAAYNIPDAGVTREGIGRILSAVQRTGRGDLSFVRDAPQTAALQAEAGQFLRTLASGDRQGTVRPIAMQRIEQLRRRIDARFRQADNANDRRQVLLIKQAFDAELDRVVADGLMSGNPDALAALKSARGLMAEYARNFFPQTRPQRGGGTRQDPAGRFVQTIVEGNPTSDEVVSALFGSEAISARAGRQMAERFGQILGRESDGWGAIRQAAFLRLIKTNRQQGGNQPRFISADQSITAFDRAMERQRELMTTLFSPQEIAQMRRFLDVVKRTQADIQRSRENPAGTGQKMAKIMSERGMQILQSLSFVNEPGTILATVGIGAVRGARARGAATRAVRPFDRVRSTGPAAAGLVGTGVAAGRAATEQ